MKPFRLLQGLVLCIASAALAGSPANRPAAGPGSSLAEQLARKEASVGALDHHLTTAAQKKPGPAVDPRLAERAKKLAQHHAKVPMASLQYVRTVPGAVDVSTSYRPEVAQREAESAAAALGDDLNALWARRKQVEAERMVLWSKIAFRAVAARELSDQPLYRFELKALAGKTADAQRIEAMMAAAQFVRVVDHLAGQAQDAVDTDAPAVYDQWHKLLADARKRLEDKLLLQADLAMDVYKPTTEAGRLAAEARQLSDLAQAIVDDQRALAAADKAEDDEEADASRAQLQKALADTAAAVAELDASVNRAAKAWGISVVPGTKAAVGELPDLLVTGDAVVATSPGAEGESNRGAWIDLLKLVEVSRDSVSGQWQQQKEGLTSDTARFTRIQLPYEPPEEYDFRISFTRVTGNADVQQFCVVAGRQFVWLMEGGEKRMRFAGLDLVNGKQGHQNLTTLKLILKNGQKYTSLVQVRKAGIRAYIDGNLLVDYKTDGSELSLRKEWRLKSGTVLALGTFESRTTFHSAEVLEVSGKGKIIPAAVDSRADSRSLAASRPK